MRKLIGMLIKGAEFVSPLFDLAIRLWVANVFFRSGIVKLQSWDSTLALFAYEYAVPVLPPELAAWLATGFELSLPVLLAIGLGARFSAALLFVLNIVAATSYPDISIAGIKDHMLWGVMLAVTLFHGPGKLAIDHLVQRRFRVRGK